MGIENGCVKIYVLVGVNLCFVMFYDFCIEMSKIEQYRLREC